MTGVISVGWHVAPASPPIALRHCGTCRQTMPFRSSGKVRLNANGRKLDAWLIYKCRSCDRTWNCTLYERMDVGAFDHDTLLAMQHSHASWVQAQELDVAALMQHCDRIEHCREVKIWKPPFFDLPGDWRHIRLQIRVLAQTGARLDRVLAGEFTLSRSAMERLIQDGLLHINPSPKQLRRTLRSDVTLTIDRGILTAIDQRTVQNALFAQWTEPTET